MQPASLQSNTFSIEGVEGSGEICSLSSLTSFILNEFLIYGKVEVIISDCTFVNSTIECNGNVQLTNCVFKDNKTDKPMIEVKPVDFNKEFKADQGIQFGTIPQPKKQQYPAKMSTEVVNNFWKEFKKKEVENTMTNETMEQTQQKYLLDRARNVYYGLEEKLYDQFNIHDDDAPTTKEDFLARVTAGEFVIISSDGSKIAANDWDDDEDETDFGLMNSIRWRDPAKKADPKGKDIAWKALQDKLTATKDIIMVSDAATGLKAVQDLETWVPSNLPS